MAGFISVAVVAEDLQGTPSDAAVFIMATGAIIRA